MISQNLRSRTESGSVVEEIGVESKRTREGGDPKLLPLMKESDIGKSVAGSSNRLLG